MVDLAVANLVIAGASTKGEWQGRSIDWLDDRVGSVGESNGICMVTTFLDFHGVAAYCTTAVALARELRDAVGTGVSIYPDLVNATEISRRTGRTRQAIHQYADGNRGPGSFPAHLCVLGDVRVWDWGSVNEWFRVFDGSGDVEYNPPFAVVGAINAELVGLSLPSATAQ